MNDKNEKVYKIVITGLMAALCYVAFTYLKIPIPTFGGDMVALHIGNAFCVLAALLLGGFYGGLAGSLGMTIADLIDPAYVTSAPKTFFLKLCIGSQNCPYYRQSRQPIRVQMDSHRLRGRSGI